jgi:hypothetical protein
LREGEDGFGDFAGVVGVGVEEVLGEREFGCGGWGEQGDAFPGEGGGYLERDAGEGFGAGVAKGEAGAHGEQRDGRGDAGVEIVGGDGEGGTGSLGQVGDGGGHGAGGTVLGGYGWIAVAFEEDFAVGGGFWRGGGGRGGGLSVDGHGGEEQGEGELGCEVQGEAPSSCAISVSTWNWQR